MKKKENERQGIEAQKTVKSVPATPVSTKKRKIFKRVACIVGAALAVVGVFFSGWFARWFSIEPEMRSLITVKDRIDAEYYEDVSNERFYEAIFGAINDEVLDKYSGYMTAEEYAAETESMKGKQLGIGLVLRTQDENGNPQILVTRVCGNSPAETANIPVGAKIVGFGKSETQLTRSEVYDDFKSFLETCAEDESFFIEYTHAGERVVSSICRSAYVENYVFYRTNKSAYTFTGKNALTATERGESLSVLDNDTAYIRLIQFTGNAAKEFDEAMKLFKQDGKKNLVIDLRGNGGGYMDVLADIASYFCKDGSAKPTVAVADYGEKREKFKADRNLYKQFFGADSRICVLADGDSASASECLLGCMLDYGALTYEDICLSEWNGEAKTYGKGIMQTTYYVDPIKKDAVTLTTAQIRWPVSDTCIHGRGILETDGTKKVVGSYEREIELQNAIKALF